MLEATGGVAQKNLTENDEIELIRPSIRFIWFCIMWEMRGKGFSFIYRIFSISKHDTDQQLNTF